MGNLSNILIIVFCVGTVFFLAQISIVNINNTNTNTLYNCNDTIMKRYGSCSNTDVNGAVLNSDASNVLNQFPVSESQNSDIATVVVQTISNIFNSIKNWLSQTLGLDYLQVAMNTPKLVLQTFNLPSGFVWAIGGLLTAMIVFFFIDWMKGAFA